MHEHDVPEIATLRIFGGTPVDEEEKAPWRGPFHFVEGWAVDVDGGRWDWEVWAYWRWAAEWLDDAPSDAPDAPTLDDLIPFEIPTYGRVWLSPSTESSFNFNAIIVEDLVSFALLDALKVAPQQARAVVFSPTSFGFEEENFGSAHFE